MRGEMPLPSPDKAAPPRESSIIDQIIGNQTYICCVHVKIEALTFTFLAARAAVRAIDLLSLKTIRYV